MLRVQAMKMLEPKHMRSNIKVTLRGKQKLIYMLMKKFSQEHKLILTPRQDKKMKRICKHLRKLKGWILPSQLQVLVQRSVIANSIKTRIIVLGTFGTTTIVSFP